MPTTGATSSQARSRQVIGSASTVRALAKKPPGGSGRYGGGSGVPSVRPAIVRCRFATQRVAGSTGREDAEPDPDDDQHAADDPEDEQHDQQRSTRKSWATAYPVSRRRPGVPVVVGGAHRAILSGRPDLAQWCRHHHGPGPCAPDARRPQIRGWKHPKTRPTQERRPWATH